MLFWLIGNLLFSIAWDCLVNRFSLSLSRLLIILAFLYCVVSNFLCTWHILCVCWRRLLPTDLLNKALTRVNNPLKYFSSVFSLFKRRCQNLVRGTRVANLTLLSSAGIFHLVSPISDREMYRPTGPWPSIFIKVTHTIDVWFCLGWRTWTAYVMISSLYVCEA